jgi:hypothetical protein
MQQNKGNKCTLKPKLEVNNLESKNMEHKFFFLALDPWCLYNICVQINWGSQDVCKVDCSKIQKNNAKCKVQTYNFYLWFAKHILKLGYIRFPNRNWHLTLAFYNSRILYGFDTNDHIQQEQGKIKLKQSST